MKQHTLSRNLHGSRPARPTRPLISSMFLSIRSRVLLLVLATLLPGLLGVAWLISSTYSAEREAHERSLRDTARAVSQVVDSELMRRATIARVL